MVEIKIIKQRLCNQHIVHSKCKTPQEVVSRLGAVQAQDYPGALWSIGLRLKDYNEEDIEKAVIDKKIARTWLMRGTLHFVSTEDIHWMLALFSPRIISGMKRRSEQLKLTEEIFSKSREIFTNELKGGKNLTRDKLIELLEKNNISTENQRSYRILARLALEGLICFGPRYKKQHTFLLLDELTTNPRKMSFDESLAELSRRYFNGHGPATLQDFVWWSGLKISDARKGLEMITSEIAQKTISNKTYFMPKNIPVDKKISKSAYALPGFDEYLISYKDRSEVLHKDNYNKIVPGNNGMFLPTIILDGKVAGIWKKTIKKNSIDIKLIPFTKFSKENLKEINTAMDDYSKFMNKPISLKYPS